MLYLLTFTEAAIVCDFTIILETIPSVIFEKRHICQCGSYPFTDCWGPKQKADHRTENTAVELPRLKRKRSIYLSRICRGVRMEFIPDTLSILKFFK